jgi:hypothetical protein
MKKPDDEEKKVEVITEFYDKRQTYENIEARRDTLKLDALSRSVKVEVRPKRDPIEKLFERLNTYHNIRRMRTEYKNYVRAFGVPASLDVPSEISRKYFHEK